MEYQRSNVVNDTKLKLLTRSFAYKRRKTKHTDKVMFLFFIERK